MEMEMRACEDTPMSQDLTRPIPPLASALHDSFLHSHCSLCFRTLTQTQFNSNGDSSLSCTACSASVRYCSVTCLASDSALHSSSGECRFFERINLSSLYSSTAETADLRVALRLLHLLETRGLDCTELPNRLGGLLVSDLEKVLEEGGELAERIKEESLLMSAARLARERPKDETKLSEFALWAVMRNSVEVQLSEGRSVGVAVYGPRFSWFNHSCCPNSCYRFELATLCGESNYMSCESTTPDRVLVLPASTGEKPDMWKQWNYKKGIMNQGSSAFGPRVIVRSMQPIKKGEEVCITYTDLLQPKATRNIDLWSKYRFICYCNRCSKSPHNYLDHVLTCDARELSSDCSEYCKIPQYEELTNIIHQSIEEYTTNDNPKSCCGKLETILFQNSQFYPSHVAGLTTTKFMLHPFHHLSLNAYMALASAYKMRALILATNDQSLDMSRVSISYSLLLALATYNLFLHESSLITTTCHFLISTGESILEIVQRDKLDCNLIISGGTNNLVEFESICKQFVYCMSNLVSKSWTFLVKDIPYLEKLKNPLYFSWIGDKILPPQVSVIKDECFACKCKSEDFVEEERNLLCLAVHCLSYGIYLANICYGSDNYLADHAKNLLGRDML